MTRAFWVVLLLVLGTGTSALGQAAPAAPAPSSTPSASPAPTAPPAAQPASTPAAEALGAATTPPQSAVVAPSEPAPAAPPPPAPEPVAPAYEPLPPAPVAQPVPPVAQPAPVYLPPPVLHAVEPRRARPERRTGPSSGPFALGLGTSLVWRADRGYDLVSETNRTPTLDVFASYDVWQPVSRLAVSAGASYRRYRDDGGIVSDLREHLVLGEVMARYRLWSWLVPHLRAGLGVVTTHVELEDVTDVSYSDRDTRVAGTVGGGVTLRTPGALFAGRSGRGSTLSFGLLVEGGMTLAPSASLRGKPDGDAHGIARTTFDLGSLDRSAPYLRILGVLRF